MIMRSKKCQAAKGGSGAFVLSEGSPKVHCCQYAYATYFRYDSTTIKGLYVCEKADSFTDIVKELNAKIRQGKLKECECLSKP